MARQPLTETEKIEIISHVKNYGNEWTKIKQNIGRSTATVKSFYHSYLAH